MAGLLVDLIGDCHRHNAQRHPAEALFDNQQTEVTLTQRRSSAFGGRVSKNKLLRRAALMCCLLFDKSGKDRCRFR